jgi:hypothetical protein
MSKKRVVPRWAAITALSSGTILLFLLVAISPVALGLFTGKDIDWQLLSNIGQAYGGVSALLSAFALATIGISVYQQQRLLRIEVRGSERQQYLELMKMAIDDGELLEVIDINVSRKPNSRQLVFANMIMGYWWTMWKHGEMSDRTVLAVATDLFQNPICRSYWAEVRSSWAEGYSGRDQRFVDIIDTSCLKVVTEAVEPTEHPSPEGASPPPAP